MADDDEHAIYMAPGNAEVPAAAASSPVAPAAGDADKPTPAPANAYALDYAKGCRATWAAVTRCCARTAITAAVCASLPAIFVSCALGFVNSQSAYAGVFQEAYAIAGSYVTALSIGTYTFWLLSLVSIWRAWPGILSFCAWTAEVTAHFLLVLTWLVLISSVHVASLVAWDGYSRALGYVMLALCSATFVWSFAGAVMSRRRELLSGLE